MPLFSKHSNVIELTPSNFVNNKVKHPSLKHNKGVIAYLAGWCGHCKRFSPVYDETADILGKSFPLFYLDCEKYSDLVSNLGIDGFPTIKYIDRTGKPYKDYTEPRDTQSLLTDICKESQVCKRK